MNTIEVINLAATYHETHGHMPMHSSAALCLNDAIDAFERGDEPAARARALKALAYLIGTTHPDYRMAQA